MGFATGMRIICPSMYIYFPTRGMGEKPSPLGKDFSLIVDVASRIQGVQGMAVRLR
jgi:hypothetical protein